MDEKDAYAAAYRFFAEVLVRRLQAGDIVRALDPLGSETRVEILCGGKEPHSLHLWKRAGASHRSDGGFGSKVVDRLPEWVISEGNVMLATFAFEFVEEAGE